MQARALQIGRPRETDLQGSPLDAATSSIERTTVGATLSGRLRGGTHVGAPSLATPAAVPRPVARGIPIRRAARPRRSPADTPRDPTADAASATWTEPGAFDRAAGGGVRQVGGAAAGPDHRRAIAALSHPTLALHPRRRGATGGMAGPTRPRPDRTDNTAGDTR